MSASFEVKTARFIKMFGHDTYPDGHLLYVSLSTVNNAHGKWSVTVHLNPSGDKVIHLRDHGITKMTLWPALTTYGMLGLPNDSKRRAYDKLPNYVKEELNTVSGLANNHQFGLVHLPA